MPRDAQSVSNQKDQYIEQYLPSHAIKKRWQNWLKHRFLFDQNKVLAQRDVLVFINREGYLYLILIIITFIAGINYGNNLVLGLCFLLMSLLVLSFYLAFRQLYRLNLALNIPTLAQVNETSELKYQFAPCTDQIHLQLHLQFEQQFKKISVLQSPLSITFFYTPQKRGKCILPRLHIASVYPFGIVKAWSLLYPKQPVWVAPRPLEVDLKQYGFSKHSGQHQQGIEDFSHLREFVQGDRLNRIAWQQYAKGRGMLVKEFEEVLHTQLNFHYNEMPMSLHEDKLSQLMYLVQYAYDHQQAFSLTLPTQKIALGQGETHFQQAKLMLAQEP